VIVGHHIIIDNSGLSALPVIGQVYLLLEKVHFQLLLTLTHLHVESIQGHLLVLMENHQLSVDNGDVRLQVHDHLLLCTSILQHEYYILVRQHQQAITSRVESHVQHIEIKPLALEFGHGSSIISQLYPNNFCPGDLQHEHHNLIANHPSKDMMGVASSW
jgi:hypothetical protein